jgi:hypothetical protein
VGAQGAQPDDTAEHGPPEKGATRWSSRKEHHLGEERAEPLALPSGEPGVEARRRGNSAACGIEARVEEGRSERSAQAGAGRATGAAAVRVGREPSLWSIHAGACAAESEQRESS